MSSMARSWRKPAPWCFTPLTAYPTPWKVALTSSFSTWFCCWRRWTMKGRLGAGSARNCSTDFAVISTPVCAKWASATSQFQRECANSARRFMEGRRPISRLCAQLTAGSLRRHWRAISFMERMVMDHAAWGGMRASWRTNLRFMIKAHCCAARLPFPTRRPSPFLNQPCLSPRMSEPPMPESKSRSSAAPWHVPVAVEEVAETGQHFDLVAEAPVRAAIAKIVGLRDLPRFEASFNVTRRGGGLHVVGSISATVGQNCVVTLEPLANEVEETIDLVFEPPQQLPEAENEGQQHSLKWDAPEPLFGGVVDLGALATEFLVLGLDPYPRKPGAVFEPPPYAKPDQGPFAALGRLAKRQD